MEPSWAPPDHRLDDAIVRRTIMVQHWIRGLLVHAREVAELALDQNVHPPDAVATAIGEIRATFEVHLTFEERVLPPVFEDDPSSGPARAPRLREDHARQRATLAALDAEAKAGPFVPMLAAKLAFLASWLLDDMAEEERTVFASEAPSA